MKHVQVHTTEHVSVHPLVLLSVVDHYNRVAKDTRKRAVGILLGERRKVGCSCWLSVSVEFIRGLEVLTGYFGLK